MSTESTPVVAILNDGRMQPTKTKPRCPGNANFVIVCHYGDWSGFRTLAECEAQYPELESKGKPWGYYWVEER